MSSPHVELDIEPWRKACRRWDARAVTAMRNAGYEDRAEKIRRELERRSIDMAIRTEKERKRLESERKALIKQAAIAFKRGVFMGLWPKDMGTILNEVCSDHGVSKTDMRGKYRGKHIAAARQEFYYRCRMELPVSFPMIARFLGGRDHTTAIHGANRHADQHNLPRYNEPRMEAAE